MLTTTYAFKMGYLGCRVQGGKAGGLMEVRRPMWVSKMTAVVDKGGWQLIGNNRNQGVFDAVVIAHNGKCANRYV